MVIDAHAHIGRNEYSNHHLYLEHLVACGIDGGMVTPGGMLDVRRMTDYIVGRAQPEHPAPDNAYVEHVCREHPGVLHGVICLDPHQHDAVDALVGGFALGFKVLKLSPITHEFSFASAAVASLAACCRERGYPVYSHVLYNPGASTARFIALARQFPQVNFILGHMGFGPADQEGLSAAVDLDNFYLETSTAYPLHLAEAIRRAGPGKLIFGSEYPLSHPAVELYKIMLLNLKDAEREQVLSGNIRGLCHLT